MRLFADFGVRVRVMLSFTIVRAIMQSPLAAMRTPQAALIVHAVTDRPIGDGSLLEVLRRDAQSDIEAEYDLASLGEVYRTHAPFCYPPRWMVSYKERASAKKGDRIQPKKQRENQKVLQLHERFFSYGRPV